jgi:O-antigen/teichoic acid export membrane protein
MLKSYLGELSRNSILYGLGTAVRRFFAVFTAPIMTRVFTPEDYGVITLVTATVSFFGLVFSLGINAGVFRHYYDVDKEVRRTLLFSGVVTQTGLLLTIVLVALPFTPRISNLIFGVETYSGILRLALVQVVLVEFFEHFSTLLRYQRRPVTFFGLSVVQLSASLGFLLLFVVVFDLGIPGVFWATICANSIGAVVAIGMLYRYYAPKIDLGFIWDCIAFSMPMMPGWFINMYLMRANRFYIQAYQSAEEVGIFSISEKIAGLTNVVMVMFFLAWDPISMKLIKEKENHYIYDTVARVFLWLSSVLIVAVMLYSKEALILLATEAYYPAFRYVGALALGTMTFYMSNFLGQGTIITKRTGFQSWARGFGAIVATVAFVTLVPRYGIIGACWGLVLGYLTASIALYFYSEKEYHLPFHAGRLLSAYLLLSSIVLVFTWTATDEFAITASGVLAKAAFVLVSIVAFGILVLRGWEQQAILKWLRRR